MARHITLVTASAAAIVAISTFPTNVQAADSTWSNIGSDFNTAANWSAGVPGAGNIATFPAATPVNPNLSASLSIGQLTFLGGGYTLSASAGQALTLSNATAISAPNTSGTNTISADLVLSGGATKGIYQAGSGTLSITGVISESTAGTGVTYGRTAAAFPSFSVTGLNTYSGNTTLLDGTFTINTFGMAGSASSLGKSSIFNFGTANSSRTSTLKYIGAGETTDKVFTLASGSGSRVIDTTGAGGGLVFTSNLAILSGSNASVLLGFTGNTTGNAFNGNIGDVNATNALSISKGGTGVWAFGGANTYTGSTSVNTGTLLINGNSSSATGAVSVSSSATLGGKGTIGGITTLASGAKLGAADGVGSPLTFSNAAATALDIAAAVGGSNAGKLAFELGLPASSDKVVLSSATGGLNIGSGVLNFADFSFSTLGGLQNGTYILFDTQTAITGTLSASGLSGVIGSGTGTLSMGDSNHDIVLTVVGIPEPGALALISSAAVLLAGRRRRRMTA